MQFSASYAVSYVKDQNSYVYIQDHLQITIVGLICMFIVAKIDYHNYYRLSVFAYLGSVAGMILILIFCDPINGAKRWIYFEEFRSLPAIQVSEIVKFAMVLITAFFICQFRKQGKNKWGELLWPLGCLIPVAIIMLLQPHVSGAIIICAMVGTMILLVGAGGKQLFKMMIAAVVLVPALGFAAWNIEGVSTRVMSRLSEWTFEVSEMGWQTKQSIYAIGSGQIFGLGLGNGVQKQMWLPEPTNDFIFSVICEELGFVGAVVVILLFVALIVEGLFIGYTAEDLYGSLIAFGITAQIGWQVFFNIGVVTSLLPNTGISLPFFSSGSSALLMILLEIGVLLSVARAGALARAKRFEEEANNAALEREKRLAQVRSETETFTR